MRLRAEVLADGESANGSTAPHLPIVGVHEQREGLRWRDRHVCSGANMDILPVTLRHPHADARFGVVQLGLPVPIACEVNHR